MKLMKTTALACLLASSAFTSASLAGGFSRGEADTDILFEDGSVAIRGGALFVAPSRSFETIAGAATDDGAYTNSYYIPSFAMKFGLSERFACAFTYTTAFGADVTYGPDALANGASARDKEFTSDEYGATCDVNFDAGRGQLHLIGGAFMQDFSYEAVSVTGATAGILRLEDEMAYGYRLGVAYEIEEYALRAQLMYRSAVKHETNEGSFTYTALPLGTQDAYGSGTLPQSLKLSLQSGVAPGWLVFGSVKWTDWSVLDALDYAVYLPLLPGYVPRRDVYNWKDGWTFQAGVGHAFTETVSGSVSLTYDTGVGTGADIMTDTWTLALGTLIKHENAEIRLGGGVTYLTGGSQSMADGATYDATADGDWSYALGGSVRVTF